MKTADVRLLVLAVFALLFPAVAHAQAPKAAPSPSVPSVPSVVTVTGTMTERQRASLAGLGPFVVVVGAFSPDVEAAGVHQVGIMTDTLALLKRSGVLVATNPSARNDPNVPRLDSKADVHKVGTTGNAYTVLLVVEVIQQVVIQRSKQRIALPTWRLIDYGVLMKESLPTVRGRIGQSVGVFVSDYKAANQKGR